MELFFKQSLQGNLSISSLEKVIAYLKDAGEPINGSTFSIAMVEGLIQKIKVQRKMIEMLKPNNDLSFEELVAEVRLDKEEKLSLIKKETDDDLSCKANRC